VAVSFDEEAPASVIRSHRTLQLERLKPGRYLIEAQVSTPDGTSVARRREFSVIRSES
jgi:hypothetical protein